MGDKMENFEDLNKIWKAAETTLANKETKTSPYGTGENVKYPK